MSEEGSQHPELRTGIVKATFGWDALFDTANTARVWDTIASLGTSGEGWSSGMYERDGAPNTALTLNTIGILLQSLCFKVFGPMWNWPPARE